MSAASAADWIDLTTATAVTWCLLDQLGLDRVRVDRLPARSDAKWAHTDCRSMVQYQPSVQVWVVAHEVAHIAVGREGHTARWLAMYVRCLPIAVRCLTARLASLGDGPTAAPPPPAPA